MAAETSTVNKVKAWFAPVLLSGISFIFWQDITEMKADVKKLVSESEYRRGKEEQIEIDIIDLKNTVYFGRKSLTSLDLNKKKERTEKKIPIDFIHRETYYLKRNLKPVLEA